MTRIRTFDTPINTGDQSLARVLAAGLPVLLVFAKATTSSSLEQAMDRLASQQAGALLVAKIDPQENPQASRTYGITSPPALVALRNGQIVSQAQGITPADLERHAAYLLGTGPKPEAAPSTKPIGSQTSSGKPMVVTEATFAQQVLQASQPVLVDFWAPWCGPCRMVEPLVEKFAHEFAGRLRVAKVNVDENPRVQAQFGIQGIPTMIIVKDGKVVDRWTGALPEGALRSRVQPWIG